MSVSKAIEAPAHKELLNHLPLSIYSEIDPLRKVAMWGRPGTPAVLAQLYPTSLSLFQNSMDVPKAGIETTSFIDVLQKFGVEVVVVRDELAKILTETPRRKPIKNGEVIDALVAKANHIQDKYGDSPFGRGAINDMLAFELERDINSYGDDTAFALNHILSLSKELPMGNIYFARDQANVLLGRMVRSSMAKPIRKPEVSLYNMVYDVLGLKNPIHIPSGETFEGGDAYIHSNKENDTVYVGVGARSTMGAALAIYQELKPDLKETGDRFALVVDPTVSSKSAQQQMDDMHLDTGGMPVQNGVKIVCEEEAANRHVYFVSDDPDGQPQIIDSNRSYLDHLVSEGNDVIALPREEQQTFGVNNLVLDEGNILVPLDSNRTTVNALTERGINVISLDLRECTKGFGAAHCMVNQLVRDRHEPYYENNRKRNDRGVEKKAPTSR